MHFFAAGFAGWSDRFGFGFDLIVFGFSVDTGTTWTDRGELIVQEVDLAQEITQLLSPSFWQSQAQVLSTVQ